MIKFPFVHRDIQPSVSSNSKTSAKKELENQIRIQNEEYFKVYDELVKMNMPVKDQIKILQSNDLTVPIDDGSGQQVSSTFKIDNRPFSKCITYSIDRSHFTSLG